MNLGDETTVVAVNARKLRKLLEKYENHKGEIIVKAEKIQGDPEEIAFDATEGLGMTILTKNSNRE